jgi:hypothetical protein
MAHFNFSHSRFQVPSVVTKSTLVLAGLRNNAKLLEHGILIKNTPTLDD